MILKFKTDVFKNSSLRIKIDLNYFKTTILKNLIMSFLKRKRKH